MSFLNDLVGFKSKITLSHFAIGGFTLDAIVEEAFEASVTLTESAVESSVKPPIAKWLSVILDLKPTRSFRKLID